MECTVEFLIIFKRIADAELKGGRVGRGVVVVAVVAAAVGVGVAVVGVTDVVDDDWPAKNA